MPIRIKCASCQTLAQVPDNCQGKKARCPKCGAIMQVPLASAATVTAQPPIAVAPVSSKPAPANAVTQKAPLAVPIAKPKAAESFPTMPPLIELPARAPVRRASSNKPWIMVAAGGGALLVLGTIISILGGGPKPVQIAQAHAPADKAPSNSRVGSVSHPEKAEPEEQSKAPPLQQLPKQVETPTERAPEQPVDRVAMTLKVKKSTACLKVTSEKGEVGQGSGFFALEPGLLFTNAHVLSMLTRNSPMPARIEVIIHSGESDEFTRLAQVMGVDRINDLALLRLDPGSEALPPPLPVDTTAKMSEIQKIYFFGFPYGEILGKNITITETVITSIRKDAEGNVVEVQVSGGINPGNSGGPMVDTRGVVVGVAVSGMRGTDLKFAVPGEKVLDLLRGHVSELQFGERFLDKSETKLAVKMHCLDPLSRLRDLKLDVWAGNAGPARPASFTKPEALAKDGPHRTLAVSYKNNEASAELPLPRLDKGQVLWVQPMLTNVAGVPHWGPAKAFKDFDYPPLDRKPALLKLNYDRAGEHTVKWRIALGAQFSKSNYTNMMTMDAEAVETVRKEGQGGQVHLCLAKAFDDISGVDKDKINQISKVLDLLRGRYFSFATKQDGTVSQRAYPAMEAGKLLNMRSMYEGNVHIIANSFELTCLPVPNRQVQPKETWPAVLPMSLGQEFGNAKIELVLTCTYEGSRPIKGQNMGLIGLSGNLRRRQGANVLEVGGQITGKAHFAIDGGYLHDAKLRVEAELGNNSSGTQVMEVVLNRGPGNTTGLKPTQAPPTAVNPNSPVPVAVIVKGKSLISDDGVLNEKSPSNYAGRPGIPFKLYTVNLEAGKTYAIEMNRTNTQTNLDPFLVLADPQGQKLADDDDSGGDLNSRIIYKPATAGAYQIYAMALEPGQVGSYRFMVSEVANIKSAKGAQ